MIRILGFMLLLLANVQAFGHALGASFLNIHEQLPGQYSTAWLPSKALANVSAPIQFRYPSECTATIAGVDCAGQPLMGELVLDGLPLHAEVIVRLQSRNGQQQTEIINGQDPVVAFDANVAPNGMWNTVKVYATLGAEHIVFGYDHLLFVLGLLLLIGFNKKLLITVTAFTVSHSITLTLGMANLLLVTPLYVELMIALSIVLIAVEVLRNQVTLAQRFPAVIAFVFGLIHGLGFAGALKDIGLPEGAFALSLFAFNLGVELGQIGVLLVLYGLHRTVRNVRFSVILQPRIRYFTSYFLGAMGTFWFVERLVQ